jgi:hypothetical protein
MTGYVKVRVSRGGTSVEIEATRVVYNWDNKIVPVIRPRSTGSWSSGPSTQVVNLLMITRVITVEGFIINDATSAETKRDTLESLGTPTAKPGTVTVEWRDTSYTDCYMTKFQVTDDITTSEPVTTSGGTKTVKLGVSISFTRGTDR